jgi:hypothetical protein
VGVRSQGGLKNRMGPEDRGISPPQAGGKDRYRQIDPIRPHCNPHSAPQRSAENENPTKSIPIPIPAVYTFFSHAVMYYYRDLS